MFRLRAHFQIVVEGRVREIKNVRAINEGMSCDRVDRVNHKLHNRRDAALVIIYTVQT